MPFKHGLVVRDAAGGSVEFQDDPAYSGRYDYTPLQIGPGRYRHGLQASVSDFTGLGPGIPYSPPSYFPDEDLPEVIYTVKGTVRDPTGLVRLPGVTSTGKYGVGQVGPFNDVSLADVESVGASSSNNYQIEGRGGLQILWEKNFAVGSGYNGPAQEVQVDWNGPYEAFDYQGLSSAIQSLIQMEGGTMLYMYIYRGGVTEVVDGVEQVYYRIIVDYMFGNGQGLFATSTVLSTVVNTVSAIATYIIKSNNTQITYR